MTTFTASGSAVVFSTSGTATTFTVTSTPTAFTTSPVVTPGAHASTHGAGGADPITTLGTVTTTLATITGGTATSFTINTATFGTATMTLGTATTLQAGTATFSAASVGNVSNTEIGYLDGVTSALQGQIDAKAPLASPTFTGTATIPTASIGTVTATLGTVTTLVASTATLSAGTAAGLVHTGQSIFAAGSALGPSLAFTGDTNTGIYSPGADQVGIATAGTARVLVDSVGLITGTGTSLGAWTAYTPVLSGTGWALGDGTVTGKYVRIGKTVLFWAYCVAGSTTTFGSGNPVLTLPLTSNADAVEGRYNVAFFDTSTSTRYFARAVPTTTTVIMVTVGTNGVQVTTNSTTPFTWAVGDAITASGWYEVS